MILPNIRASVGRGEALHLVDLVGRHDPEALHAAHEQLEHGGLDALLDDPRLLNAVLTERDVRVRPELVFYILVRQALLERGVDDVPSSDYVASLVVQFGQARRAYRVSRDGEEEYGYLVDLLDKLSDAGGSEAFLIRTHMGNFALWLTGLFPDFLEARVQRRGAPPVSYYERLGVNGYRTASTSPEAAKLGLREVLSSIGEHFAGVRSALNRLSDRHLWRDGADPVGRLLREVGYAAE